MELPPPLSILDPRFPSVESCDAHTSALQALDVTDVNRARKERKRKEMEREVKIRKEWREYEVKQKLTLALGDALDYYETTTEITDVVDLILRRLVQERM